MNSGAVFTDLRFFISGRTGCAVGCAVEQNKMLAAGVVIPLYAHHQLVMTGACENQSIASRTTYVYFWYCHQA